MRISTFLLAMSLASAGLVSASAQNNLSDQQKKALDLLHRALADHKSAPMAEAAPAPTLSDSQQKALQLLRQALAQQQSAPATADKSVKATKATKAKTGSASTSVQAAPQASGAGVAAPAPAPRTGPMTKQERLAELLEQYKADKLTPAQYHDSRAKILAEP